MTTRRYALRDDQWEQYFLASAEFRCHQSIESSTKLADRTLKPQTLLPTMIRGV